MSTTDAPDTASAEIGLSSLTAATGWHKAPFASAAPRASETMGRFMVLSDGFAGRPITLASGHERFEVPQ